MKTPRKASPARSQGPVRTPIRHKPRRTLSVTSARSSAAVILSALTQQRKDNASFVVSPLGSRKSILSDNTEIEDPRRKSWWKNLGENSTTSRDMELLEENENLEPDNFIEELDMEILSQENKKNYTLELPESSDSESINSIVITQRKLFSQRENQEKKPFAQIVGSRESLAKRNETVVDKTLVTGTRELFQNKQRTRPIFPAALLNISLNKTVAEKTPKAQAQVRNIFGQRDTKRKNIFTNFNNFIVTESEEEIPDIQPKVFAFQKTIEASRRSSVRGIREPSPASSITTDMEMDDWKMLPSSTMVENQIEVMMTGQTPKRARLSNLAERESEAGSNTSKPSKKSNSSKEDKSRKSKTFTKENVHGIDPEEIVECDHETSGNIDKLRKSKTFTKDYEMINKSTNLVDENESQNKSTKDATKSRKSKTFIKEIVDLETSRTPRNKSKMQLNDQITQHETDYENINKSINLVDDNESQNKSTKDTSKSRKSKTFIKEIVDLETSRTIRNKSKMQLNDQGTQHETDYEMINKSTNLVDDNESQNKSTKDTTKSRKSKTFIKEIVDLETSRTIRNQSKVQLNDKVENKSKTKISEHNISMNTRSQSKNTSPSNSQVNEEADLKSQTTNKNKTISLSKGFENIEENNPDEEKNNDDELNFSLHYEDDHDGEEVPEIKNKSLTSKSMTQKDIIRADSSEEDKTLPKIVEESAEVESSHEENISKGVSIDKNHEHGDLSLHASGNDLERAEKVESEQKSMNKSKDISQEIENKGEQKNESEVAPDEVDHASVYEEDNVKPNDLEGADNVESDQKSMNKSKDISQDIENDAERKNESEVAPNELENASDNEEENGNTNECQASDKIGNISDNKVHDLSLKQNQSEPENECQEVEDDNEENQNETHADSDTELNDSQVQNESDIEQNESQVQNESNTDQNESQMQNESDTEQNENQEVEEYDDEEQDSDDEDQNIENSPDNSQDKGVDSENQEESAVDEIIETPNESHDTTGRNRKKNKSPEAVLHHSGNLINSFYSVKGDKTVRKTEMLKSTHRDLVPLSESAGFSDGSNSSAQGSGWDSHRTTRKTLRLTYGRDFTPRKSLRALVMEKSAKRQTQHNEIASVTGPLFPQANSTEMPSTRFDDEDEDENENRSTNDISLRTRQTTIEKYLMGVAKINAERRKKSEEKVLNSLKEQPTHNIFKIPATPLFAFKTASKPKQSKSAMRSIKVTKLFGELPQEVLEDLMYKPPKRFQPRDAPWATKHLYKFLEAKLEPKYNYKSRVRAERLVEHLYNFTKDLRRRSVASPDAVEVLKREMARLRVVRTHHEFYEFFGQFMPRDVRRKVMPDLINNIALPRQGVFSDIL